MMHEAKNTQRALVRIGFDGRVHKLFRGPEAQTRFDNEVRVLRYLEHRKCPFVPRLLEVSNDTLEIVTSNCGARVEHISEDRVQEVFAELEKYGVRHEDAFMRNITYRASDGRFCAIDFEFADIIGEPLSEPSATARPNSLATKIAWSGKTDRGRVRANNEDAFLALLLDGRGIRYLGKTGESSLENADFIFAVSDGMGGERSGEFASRIALEKITLQLPSQFNLSDERFATYCDDILLQLFESIHQAMLRLGKFDPNCHDMGATLTLAWFRRGRVYFGHIGDSRLYHLPVDRAPVEAGSEPVPWQAAMRQVSEDHTHVGWLRRKGELNEREARFHPRKNVLTQALGSGHRYLNPQLGVLDYQPSDQFLLCTDGVIEGLWDRAIEDMLRAPASEGRSPAEQLVATAVSESGRDNATAVVVQSS